MITKCGNNGKEGAFNKENAEKVEIGDHPGIPGNEKVSPLKMKDPTLC